MPPSLSFSGLYPGATMQNEPLGGFKADGGQASVDAGAGAGVGAAVGAAGAGAGAGAAGFAAGGGAGWSFLLQAEPSATNEINNADASFMNAAFAMRRPVGEHVDSQACRQARALRVVTVSSGRAGFP